MNIRFTLVSEGSTDAALLPIIRWTLRSDPRVEEIEAQFALPAQLPPARAGLAARLRRAIELFPADLLFVHRDSDKEEPGVRRKEIMTAVREIPSTQIAVPVVPVRMTEAWLLIDSTAIRSAAGNPRSSATLDQIPKVGKIEGLHDPKDVLHASLRSACELRGRRLAKFDMKKAANLVAERITDFTPLRSLSGYLEFERLLQLALEQVAATKPQAQEGVS